MSAFKQNYFIRLTFEVFSILFRTVAITVAVYFLLTLIPGQNNQTLEELQYASSTKLPDFYFSIMPAWYDVSLFKQASSPIKASKIAFLRHGVSMTQYNDWINKIRDAASIPGYESLATIQNMTDFEDVHSILQQNKIGLSDSLIKSLVHQTNEIQKTNLAVDYSPRLYWWGPENAFHELFFNDSLLNNSLRLIGPALKYTIYFSLIVLTFVIIFGTLMGVFIAKKKGRLATSLTALMYFVNVIPVICLSVIALQFCSNDYYSPLLNWFPAPGFLLTINSEGLIREFTVLWHLIMPALLVAFPLSAGLALRWMAGLEDEENKLYLQALQSKGLSKNLIYSKHLVKAASQPIIQYLSLLLPGLLSGALIVENVFAIPGIGRLTLQTFLRNDVSTLLILVSLICFLGIICHSIGLQLGRWIDPRLAIDRIQNSPK